MPAPKATSLIDYTTPVFAGIDVGGTNIKLGLVDSTGARLCSMAFPTENQRGPADAVERMGEHFEKLAARFSIAQTAVAGVGLGTPGTMDVFHGLILEPPNLPGWRHFPIRQAVEDKFQRPVVYVNDASAAAYGEYWIGRGKDVSNLVLLTLGTGVGGGMVIADELVQGSSGNAAECGHVTIDYCRDARICSCGMPGHLEAYASATAVARQAVSIARDNAESKIANRLAASGVMTAKDVAELATSGDELARQIVLGTAGYLARGVVVMANLVDPDLVVLGGAMDFGGADSELGQEFIGIIRDRARTDTLHQIGEHLQVEFATLGSAAGWIGAAGLAKRRYDRPD